MIKLAAFAVVPLAYLGPRPSVAGPGVVTKTYRAIVNASGTIAYGPAGTTSAPLGAGFFQVIFPSSVLGCVYTATIGAAAAGVSGPGFVSVNQRAGNANGVFVSTYSIAGKNLSQSFHLHVRC